MDRSDLAKASVSCNIIVQETFKNIFISFQEFIKETQNITDNLMNWANANSARRFGLVFIFLFLLSFPPNHKQSFSHRYVHIYEGYCLIGDKKNFI